ncbi:MAG TPA: hypothetical protein V6C97_00765 [Oculatellaceae cyanobacterium]
MIGLDWIVNVVACLVSGDAALFLDKASRAQLTGVGYQWIGPETAFSSYDGYRDAISNAINPTFLAAGEGILGLFPLFCVALHCIGLNWIGLHWIGLDWIGLDCIGVGLAIQGSTICI